MRTMGMRDDGRTADANGRIRVAIADDQELVRAGFAMVIGSQPDMQVVGQAGDGRAAVELAARLRPDVVLMDVRMPTMDGIEATRRIIGGTGAGSGSDGGAAADDPSDRVSSGDAAGGLNDGNGIDMDAELRAAMRTAAGADVGTNAATKATIPGTASSVRHIRDTIPGSGAKPVDAFNPFNPASSAGPARPARPTRVIILTTFDLDEYVMAAIKAGASGFLLKDTEPETMLNSIRTVFRGDAVIAPSATKRLIEKMMHEPEPAAVPAQPAPRPVAPEESPELASLTEREREVLVEIAHGLSNQEIARKLFIGLPTVKTHVAHILAKTYSRDRVQAVVFAYETGLVR